MQDQHNTDIDIDTDIDIEKLEEQLADLSPSPLTENLISRMEQAMISWESHLTAEEKIVPFENAAQREVQKQKKSYFPVWSTAAAVALIGAVGLTFMNSTNDLADEHLGTLAINNDHVEQPVPATIAKHFSHQLMNASNEGITYAGNDKPYKVIRIEYTKDVEHTDDKGNTVIRTEPVVEHLMVPISVH